VSREYDLISPLIALYDEMDAAYRVAAGRGSFSCQGCDGIRCCTVDLRIYTCAEMVYLRRGFNELPVAIRDEMGERARQVVAAKDRAPMGSEYRNAVCPVNFEGRCALYQYRPMICRLAGIPYIVTRPDMATIQGTGCKRFQHEVAPVHSDLVLDRSSFYLRMSEIQMDAMKSLRRKTPVQTIAEIIHYGAYGL